MLLLLLEPSNALMGVSLYSGVVWVGGWCEYIYIYIYKVLVGRCVACVGGSGCHDVYWLRESRIE